MVANTLILGAVVRAAYRGVRHDPGPPVMVDIRIVHDDDFFASLWLGQHARGDLILQ
jgi:hypothetical protein